MNVLVTMSNLKEIDFNGSKKIQMDYETFFLIISRFYGNSSTKHGLLSWDDRIG